MRIIKNNMNWCDRMVEWMIESMTQRDGCDRIDDSMISVIESMTR